MNNYYTCEETDMTDKELLILLKENTESGLRDLSEEDIEEVISDILVGKKKNMAVYRLQ